MSEAQKQLDVENDKCCFFVPIVPGMKALTGLMILFNFVALVTGFRIFTWSVPAWIKVVFGLDFVLIGGIVWLLTKWFLNDNKAGREAMVQGLMLNIIQTALQGLLVVMATSLYIYGDELLTDEQKAALAEQKKKALGESEEAKKAAAQAEKAAIAAAKLAGGAGVAGPIIMLLLTTGLAAYFWTEAKEYQKLADQAHRGDDDNAYQNADAVAEDEE